MRTLLGVIALMASSCVTSVYRCEFYRPTVDPTSVMSRLRSVQAVIGSVFSPTPVAFLASTRVPTRIRCQHRTRRYYAGGLILPVIPLFGLFGDPKDRAIILEITHGPAVTIDVGSIRGRFIEDQKPIVVSAKGSEEVYGHKDGETLLDESGDPVVSLVRDYYALDAAYSAGDGFTLEVPLTLEDGSLKTATVVFTRERRTLWDRWGTTPRRFPMEDLSPLGTD